MCLARRHPDFGLRHARAGCGAPPAQRGPQARVLDKNSCAGGHTATRIGDGYVFDEGPHVSFTKHKRIKKYFGDAIDNEYLSIDSYIDNYRRGQYIRHPVITNMDGMPRDVVVKCITDYVEAKQNVHLGRCLHRARHR
jgi:hypothetical protein